MANLQNLSVSNARLLPTIEEVRHSKIIIEELDERIANLKMQMKRLQSRREIYASYISPFRRLPTEILREIMDLALDNGAVLTTLTQICGRFRHIIFGMAKRWSVVRLLSPEVGFECRYDAFGQCMQYGTREALEFNIEYAGSTPLDLTFWTPFDGELLAPIISRNLAVRSLTFAGLNGLPNIVTDLNLTSLSHLSVDITDITMPDASRIMDAALQSTQKEIKLELELGQGDVDILKHGFLQQVTNLQLETDWSQHVSFGSRISLPRLKTLDISDNYGFLEVVDLDCIEELTLSRTFFTWQDLRPMSIPARLSDLSLRSTHLSFPLTQLHRPQFLPRLTRLSLTNVIMDHPLQRYFLFPKLKHLSISILRLHSRHTEESEVVDSCTTRLTTDINFFRGIPELNTLSLTNMVLDRGLINCLNSCPELRSMIIHSCQIKDFISSFVESEVHNTRLLALQEIHIRQSWPDLIDFSFPEFVACLAVTRPSLRIFGDGKMHSYVFF